MKNLIILIGVISGLSFNLASEPKDCFAITKETVFLQWTGDYATDGCGFMFIFPDRKLRKATNEEFIPNKFKSGYHIQEVEIEYTHINKEKSWFCMDPSEFETFKLLSIE